MHKGDVCQSGAYSSSSPLIHSLLFPSSALYSCLPIPASSVIWLTAGIADGRHWQKIGGEEKGRKQGVSLVSHTPFLYAPFPPQAASISGLCPFVAPARQAHHDPASMRWPWPLDSDTWPPFFVPLAHPVATSAIANGWISFSTSVTCVANDLIRFPV